MRVAHVHEQFLELQGGPPTPPCAPLKKRNRRPSIAEAKLANLFSGNDSGLAPINIVL